ncbi:MAG TPA: M20/M25/M40 family metallo-hydrolase [Terriglobales bacterium]|nr:M20/M25/M40 family metallo-hydrolase [Terriglobales bacterium]
MRKSSAYAGRIAVALLCLGPVGRAGVWAQAPVPGNPVEQHLRAHKAEILQEFTNLLAIPNVASDTENIEKNAGALIAMLAKRGLKAQLLRVENAPPVVYAEAPAVSGRRTVTFYAHYDGQPVQKRDWKQDPWQPVTVGDRIYARSASDDKAAIVGLVAALDALRATHQEPSVNLKFFFEGEEEAGSPHLGEVLKRYADRLQSDLWVICDGPIYQNGKPVLVFGSRGVVTAQITAFGPNRALHSGHYGNWAPNPIVELSHLIAKMRTAEGEITIPHFYDPVRPLTSAEKSALQALPNLDEQLKEELGLGRREGKGALAEEIMRPSLNLDRIEGGGSGPNPANAIPVSATAYIDFRMVPDQTPEIVKQQVESYLRELGYFTVDQAPAPSDRLKHPRLLQVTWGPGYPPQRTAIDAAVSQALIAADKTATGDDLLLMPTLGGSTPSYLFEKQFKSPVILLPIANYDNNQHAANENIRVEYLLDGTRVYAAIFANLGKYWH